LTGEVSEVTSLRTEHESVSNDYCSDDTNVPSGFSTIHHSASLAHMTLAATVRISWRIRAGNFPVPCALGCPAVYFASVGEPETDEKESSGYIPDSAAGWRELIAIVLLSVTAIATAWSGFQASKWGGEMSISFSKASTARIEASRADANANRQLSIQVQIYTQWIEAVAAEDERLSTYLSDRFPEPLATAWAAWIALNPEQNPDAPDSPFDMPEYIQPDAVAAKEADARADTLFQQALDNNQRGDRYTLLAVVFATVLFFAAVSGRVKNNFNSWLLLSVGLVLFIGAAVTLITYPKMI